MTTRTTDNQTTIYVPSPFPQKTKNRRKQLYFSVCLIFLVASIFAWQTFSGKDPLYIAVVGPMSGPSQPNGEAMVNGINLYIDEVNQKGGIDGRPVELLVYDDQNKAELAKKHALTIAKSNALAVIGHYTSNASLAAAPIYQEAGIPAITSTATADRITKEHDGYFRVMFNNSDQSALVAHYIYNVLGYKNATIIYDEDAYGSTLAKAFTQTATRIGLSIKHQWSFNTAEPSQFKNALKQMISTLEKEPPEKSGILFIATHSTEAVQVVVELRSLGRKIPIIGAESLSSNYFMQRLNEYPQERAQHGYYSDGIYTVSPFFIEMVDDIAQNFRWTFIQTYQEEPTLISATSYDTAKVLIHAINEIIADPKPTINITQQRHLIKKNLWQLSKLDNAIDGVTGPIYFNYNGDAIKSIPMGIYRKGKPIIALHQYQPLNSWQMIDNILQEVLDNKIIMVNGQFMRAAEVIYVGMDFNGISELNAHNSTFTADFYLWFRFQGNFDDKNLQFLNLLEQKPNILGKPIIERLSQDGITTRTYQVKMPFKADLAFHKYPLDTQILPIHFRHKTLTRDQLIYVTDAQGIGIYKRGGQNVEKKAQAIFSIEGWKLKKLFFFPNILINQSTLGIPELIDTQSQIEYSQFNVTMTIEREFWSIIFKTLLPPLFLVILGYLLLFIPNSAFGIRLTLGIFMIVAVTPFYLNILSELPNIGYTLLIEHFFYLIYLLATLTLAITIMTYLKSIDENRKNQLFIKRLNFFGKLLYKVILVIGGGILAYAFM